MLIQVFFILLLRWLFDVLIVNGRFDHDRFGVNRDLVDDHIGFMILDYEYLYNKSIYLNFYQLP